MKCMKNHSGKEFKTDFQVTLLSILNQSKKHTDSSGAVVSDHTLGDTGLDKGQTGVQPPLVVRFQKPLQLHPTTLQCWP